MRYLAIIAGVFQALFTAPVTIACPEVHFWKKDGGIGLIKPYLFNRIF